MEGKKDTQTGRQTNRHRQKDRHTKVNIHNTYRLSRHTYIKTNIQVSKIFKKNQTKLKNDVIVRSLLLTFFFNLFGASEISLFHFSLPSSLPLDLTIRLTFPLAPTILFFPSVFYFLPSYTSLFPFPFFTLTSFSASPYRSIDYLSSLLALWLCLPFSTFSFCNINIYEENLSLEICILDKKLFITSNGPNVLPTGALINVT